MWETWIKSRFCGVLLFSIAPIWQLVVINVLWKSEVTKSGDTWCFNVCTKIISHVFRDWTDISKIKPEMDNKWVGWCTFVQEAWTVILICGQLHFNLSTIFPTVSVTHSKNIGNFESNLCTWQRWKSSLSSICSLTTWNAQYAKNNLLCLRWIHNDRDI